MNLSGIIQSENLFQVSVQSNNLEELFSAFNKKIKNQDKRIYDLEEVVKRFVSSDIFTDKIQSIESNISTLQEKLESLTNIAAHLPDKMKDLEDRLAALFDDRAGEIMTTTMSQMDSATQNIQANMDILSRDLNEACKHIPKGNLEQEMKSMKDRIGALEEINKENGDFDEKLNDLRDDIFHEMDARFNVFSDSIDSAVVSNNEGDGNGASIEMLRMSMSKMIADMDKLKKDQTECFALISGTKEGHDDPNSLPVYKKNVQRSMIAINEAINKIISEGAGLGDIDYLQLPNNAPAIFMDNYVASEPKKVGDAKLKGRNLSAPLGVRDSRVSMSQVIEESHDNTKTGLTEDDIKTVALRVQTELKIDEIKSVLDKVEKQNAEVLSALERKVDREFDERLFEKFRVYITQLRDAVGDVNNRVCDLVTHAELDEVRKIAVSIPTKVVDVCSVGKRGPECLFCGRPKTSVTGSITARAARNIGSPPVATQTSNNMIYGDNQGFQHAESQSISRFDLLPPIANK